MFRGVLMLLAAVVLVTTAQSVAHARRLVCEAEPAISLSPDVADANDRLGDDDDHERVAAPPPGERRVCLGGFSDDAGCWPDRPLPEPGRTVPLSFPDTIVFSFSAASLPSRGVRPAQSPTLISIELAPGHARRIERPPRPVS